MAALALLASLAACHHEGDVDSPYEPPPVCEQGQPTPDITTARTAAEAWPDRPMPPVALTREELLRGCLRWSECQSPELLSQYSVAEFTTSCVTLMLFSLERAIPDSLSLLRLTSPAGQGTQDANETVEFFARCAAREQASCEEVVACLTPRTVPFGCEEDGCRSGVSRFETTCQGDVATVVSECRAPAARDCARAGTTCDPASPTGCRDRPFTRCDPGESKADRCDGDVRLGCDGKGYVSYHDCARLEGGRCQMGPGGADCVFELGPEPPCGGPRLVGEPACTPEGTATLCIYGARVAVPSSLCAPATP